MAYRFRDVTFAAGYATAFAVGPDAPGLPEMVIVNPPRRGIGSDLAHWLEASGIDHVLYSSCNATTLAKDLAENHGRTVARCFVQNVADAVAGRNGPGVDIGAFHSWVTEQLESGASHA
jgi:tRNA/tmRNA/rRNA uracil-C5-methylase (TrmA/RlmC/RlmD family)